MSNLCDCYLFTPLVRALGTQLRMVGNHLAEKLLILLMHVPSVGAELKAQWNPSGATQCDNGIQIFEDRETLSQQSRAPQPSEIAICILYIIVRPFVHYSLPSVSIICSSSTIV